MLRLVFVALAVIGALGALCLAWLPVSQALSHFAVDDMGYYLTAARNVSAGHGATLDGRSPTNGFHPLWLVMLVVVEYLFGANPIVSFHVVLTLCAVLFILTGLVLCRNIQRSAAWLTAPFAALFFLNYRLVTIPLGGLESSLAGLTVVIAAVAVSQWAGALTTGRAVLLGALLGLASLARMDALLFSGIALSWLAFRAFQIRSREQLGLAALAGGTWAVTLTPWLVFSWRAVHAWLPHSGAAILLWSPSPWSRPWTAARLTRAFRVALVNPSGNIANILGVWPLVNGPNLSRTPGLLALALAVCGLLWLTWRSRHEPSVKRLLWLWVYAILHTAYYTQFSLNPRYLYPVILVLFYVAAVVVAATARRHPRVRFQTRILACAAAMVVVTAAAGLQAYRDGFGSVYTHGMIGVVYDDVVPWVSDRTPSSSTLGAFNGGALSYFSNRTVVDLDGVMNERALDALKSGQLCRYIDEAHITYLVDDEKAIAFFVNNDDSCRATNWRDHWTVIHRVAWVSNKGQQKANWVVMQKNG